MIQEVVEVDQEADAVAYDRRNATENFAAGSAFTASARLHRVAANNRWWRRLSLIVADIVAMGVATLGALVLSDTVRTLFDIPTPNSSIPQSVITQLIMFALPMMLLLVACHSKGHYTCSKPFWFEAEDIFRIVGYTVAVVAVALFFTKAHFSRLWFIAYLALILALVPSLRYFTKRMLIRHGRFFTPVVIFGTGRNALKCAEALRREPMLGLEVVGFVNTGSLGIRSHCSEIPADMVLDSGHDRSMLNTRFDHPHLLFAPDSGEEFEANRAVLNSLVGASKSITLAPPVYGLPLDGAEVINVQPSESLLIRLQNNLAKPHKAFIKRLVDIIGSLLVLLLCMPLVLVLIVIIKADGGPLFYRQKRIGRHARVFDCWKFRSMVRNADAVLQNHLATHPEARAEWDRDHKLREDPRITRIGAFIRSGSIDELPQLWNVLKGEMSLVGPRPIVVEETVKYGERLNHYLDNRPGLTGLWQTSGRNDTTYEERVDLDVWYSRNWSLWLDIVIFFKTLPAVFMRSGAY